MDIGDIPTGLQWGEPAPAFDRIHEAFLARLTGGFELRLGTDPADAPVTTRIRDLAGRLSAATHARFLTAPETSRRIVWSSADRGESLGFWTDALLAECLREGGAEPVTRVLWTALGDACFHPDGRRESWPQVPGMMPLDFGSPHAVWTDLSGADFRASRARGPMTPAELEVSFRKVERSLGGIRDASSMAAAFVARFSKVLILQKDDTDCDQCQSGSNGQYVGRSFVTNLQSPAVTEAAVADAIVHESIHGLLYMQQLREPWGTDAILYDRTERVTSPWSGRHLPVRPFLEACFVWFGLAHFWSYALQAAAFDAAEIRKHLQRAACGFLGQPLAGLLGETTGLNAAVLSAIEAMQARVQEALG